MSALAKASDPKGLKRVCASCGIRFYDLNKRPICCPNCETEFTGEIKVKGRRSRAVPDDVVEKKGKAAAANTDDDEDEVTSDADTVSLEDLDEGKDDDEDDTPDADLDLDDDVEIVEDLDDDLDDIEEDIEVVKDDKDDN